MKSLIDLEIIIAIISLVLCALRIFNIVEIPLMLINLLFIIMISIMTWINYKNNKRIQMFIGILTILIFVWFMTL
ncbi:hypothetical protein GCM10008904_01080 [Paraclostridium ghonii]|uniref:Uncharacterized protein n=1 Tax=Paraclostridium ghonii TaxID=29358 RepID=A0ABU0N4N0_9FIRM|nr:hypothetical protein [Paeniclostridium ghonii]MDQ0557934.1 hypothetical protein [Paeniclostridium ghonii]